MVDGNANNPLITQNFTRTTGTLPGLHQEPPTHSQVHQDSTRTTGTLPGLHQESPDHSKFHQDYWDSTRTPPGTPYSPLLTQNFTRTTGTPPGLHQEPPSHPYSLKILPGLYQDYWDSTRNLPGTPLPPLLTQNFTRTLPGLLGLH
jgi:hypothetical protein